MYIDLHCHLDLFNEDEIKNIAINAKKKEVNIIINNGLCLESNKKALKIFSKYDIIKPSLGFYPPDALNLEKEYINIINKENQKNKDTITNNKNNLNRTIYNFNNPSFIEENINFIKKNINKISAIGEIGLDYKNGHDKELQKNIFTKMIELAIKHNLPIIIHSRKAELDVIEILEKYNYKKTIMHCFCGKKKLLLRAIKNNWYFTISTSVVRSIQFQEMIKTVPLTKLFCETDSPFMSPYKDKKNEPCFVIESYKMISKIKNIELEETKKAIYMNYQKLFI
jgi:TatD DNase family protein